MKSKKLTAMLLSASMLLGLLAGCGGEEKDPQKPGKDPGQVPQAKYAYQTVYQPIVTPDGGDFNYIESFTVSGTGVYLGGVYAAGKETALDENGEPMKDEQGQVIEYDSYQNGLFRMDIETGKTEKLDYEMTKLPEGTMGDSYIQYLGSAPDGTLWIGEEVRTYTFNLPEGVQPGSEESWQYYEAGENYTLMTHCDEHGAVLEQIRLELPEDVYLADFFFDSKGTIYGYSWENLYVFGQDGKITKTVPVENANEMFQLGEGKLAVIGFDQEGPGLRILNSETLEWGETEKLPDMIGSVYPGFGDYDYLYDVGDSIYGHLPQQEQGEKLFSWLDCDVDRGKLDTNQVKFLDDGRILAMESSYAENRNMIQLLTMNPVDPATLPQKEQLVLGCMYMDYDLRTNVVNFNRTHNDIRITIRDYQETAQDGNYEDAIQRMNTEILSGKGPDIISIDSVRRYAAKDLLVDLWPLIDADPELGREKLMEHFFDAMSIDGKLYGITNGFNIETAACKQSLVGDRTSWTLEEMQGALAQLEPGATALRENTTKSEMLYRMLSFNLDSFVDWESGTCSFDSPEFRSLLEFAGGFHEEIDWEHYDWENEESEYARLASRKQLMSSAFVADFTEAQVQNALHGEKVTFIGYPTTSGSGSCFMPSNQLAISAGCSNPDAAWNFVRELLLEENQQNSVSNGFPTNKAAFEAQAKEAMTPQYMTDPVTGEQIEVSSSGIGFGDDFSVDLYAVTQEEYETLMSLYNNCDKVSTHDSEIFQLIEEEAKAYFEGQKSAEETARLIQDRVGLFIMEQG